MHILFKSSLSIKIYKTNYHQIDCYNCFFFLNLVVSWFRGYGCLVYIFQKPNIVTKNQMLKYFFVIFWCYSIYVNKNVMEYKKEF